MRDQAESLISDAGGITAISQGLSEGGATPPERPEKRNASLPGCQSAGVWHPCRDAILGCMAQGYRSGLAQPLANLSDASRHQEPEPGQSA